MQRFLATIALLALIAIPTNLFAKNEDAPGLQKKSPSPETSATAGNQNLNHGHQNWQTQYDEYKNAGQEKKEETLETLGSVLADNRLALLNNLREMVLSMTNLPEETKTALLAEIDAAIQELTATQGNIAHQSGDLQQLKNEIRSMFKDQVYAVVAPKELGSALTANGMYILGRLQAIQRQLEQTLNQNKNAGKDISSLQPLITQINDQLKIAQDQLAIADAKFKSMNPANSEEAKTARDEGKTAFRLAKNALKEAHRLLVQLRAELRLMTGATSPSPSASISPIASPSISPTVSPSPSPSPTLSPSPSPTSS